MTETESTTGRAMTDPETDELADIVERAETDDAAAVALESAGGPSPLPEEPPEEPALGVESEATTELVDDLPEAGVEGPAAEDVQADEAFPAEQIDTEVAEVPELAPPPKVAASARRPPKVAASAPREIEAPAPPPEAASTSPFDGPGDWYVIHTYAGYENKVKANLGSRIGSMQMEEKIFEVVIPMEDVMEIKGGKRQVVQKKVFPGYLLVKMIYDNDSWYVVRNTPGVTGFVSSGTGTKPTPLSRREVEKILAVKKETQAKPQYRLEWEEGDVVRIVIGPFADFTGTIAEINVEQSKLKVLVNIFDRETPVELAFDQVAKS